MIGPEARGAWVQIEARLRPYVRRRVASDIDVDDVVQDVFVKIHQGLPTLQNNERFGPWVYRIASNAVTDHLRQRARTPVPIGDTASSAVVEAAVEPDDGTFGVFPEGADDQLRDDLGKCVAFFVARLASPYREAVTLTELQGLTQQEAASMVGISLSGMKSRVQRGRAHIRDMFEACCRISVDARGKVIGCESRAEAELPEDFRDAARLWAARHGCGEKGC